MVKYVLPIVLYIISATFLSGCLDTIALAHSSFKLSRKATPTSVISMGRDDDDGKAKIWHIGGRLEETEEH